MRKEGDRVLISTYAFTWLAEGAISRSRASENGSSVFPSFRSVQTM